MTDQTRHPAITDVLQYFDYGHLPAHLQDISESCSLLAQEMADGLTGPQVTHGLFLLLQAKDCFVRAAVTQHRATEAATGADA